MGATTCIDVGRDLPQRIAAIAAHRSQYAIEADMLPLPILQELMGREYFVRIHPAPRSKPNYSRRPPPLLSPRTHENGRKNQMSPDPYIFEKLAEVQAQDREGSHTRSFTSGTSGVICEILPVTLELNQVVLLYPLTGGQASSWHVWH